MTNLGVLTYYLKSTFFENHSRLLFGCALFEKISRNVDFGPLRQTSNSVSDFPKFVLFWIFLAHSHMMKLLKELSN